MSSDFSSSPFDNGPLRSRIENRICIPNDSRLAQGSLNELPGTSLSLHQLFIVVGGVCMALGGLLSLFNLITHLIWRRDLREQKHLMRMILLPLMFAVFSWLSLLYYGLGAYLQPIPRLYESFCICTFFNLMIQRLHPDEATRDAFFVNCERLKVSKRRTKLVHDRGMYRWYRYQHMIVHLIPVLLLFLTIGNISLAARECGDDSAGENAAAHAAIQIFEIIFTVTPIVAVLRTYYHNQFKSKLQGKHVMDVFWSIKALIGLYMAQMLIMTILTTADAVRGTSYMSMADFEYGILDFMLCCETFLFSIAQVFTLSGLQFRRLPPANKSGTTTDRRGADAGVLRYIASASVPVEYFRGVWLAVKFLVGAPLGRKRFDYTAGGNKRVGSQAGLASGGESGMTGYRSGGYAMLARDEEMAPPQYERDNGVKEGEGSERLLQRD